MVNSVRLTSLLVVSIDDDDSFFHPIESTGILILDLIVVLDWPINRGASGPDIVIPE